MRKCGVLTALLFVLAACSANAETVSPEVAISVPEASSDSVASTTADSSVNTDSPSPSTTVEPSTTVAPVATVPAAVASPPKEVTSESTDSPRSEILGFFDAQSPSGITSDQRVAVSSLIQRARWAVVDILFENFAQGTGTFISSDGYLVTAGHVVTGDGDYSVVTYDGRKFPATVVARNVSYAPDVAILKVDGDGFPFVPIGSTPAKGDISVYVGHPATLLWAGFGGVITGIDSSEPFDRILYTNPSDSGASGSTILGVNGDLIGVLSGELDNSLPESVVADLQDKPLWNVLEFRALLDTTGFGPTADVVADFIEKHVPGLVQANRAARNKAVTVDPGFVPPSIPSDICRVCLHWGGLMDWIKDVLANTSPLEEARYLEMMAATMQDPDGISVEERALVKSVGQSTQHAVVQLTVQTRDDVLTDSFSGGTGFFVSPDGYLITNAHVVEGAQTIEAKTFDGRTLKGTIVGSVPPDWRPDLALVKLATSGETWIPLAPDGQLEQLVVGVGHPQSLEWAIYGGRVSFWDPPPEWIDAPSHFQFDAVNVGEGSSGSPVVNMSGQLVGVVADGMVDKSFSGEWEYGVSDFVQQIVLWNKASLSAATAGRVGGPRVDAVREFIDARVPGLLVSITQ